MQSFDECKYKRSVFHRLCDISFYIFCFLLQFPCCVCVLLRKSKNNIRYYSAACENLHSILRNLICIFFFLFFSIYLLHTYTQIILDFFILVDEPHTSNRNSISIFVCADFCFACYRFILFISMSQFFITPKMKIRLMSYTLKFINNKYFQFLFSFRIYSHSNSNGKHSIDRITINFFRAEKIALVFLAY